MAIPVNRVSAMVLPPRVPDATAEIPSYTSHLPVKNEAKHHLADL